MLLCAAVCLRHHCVLLCVALCQAASPTSIPDTVSPFSARFASFPQLRGKLMVEVYEPDAPDAAIAYGEADLPSTVLDSDPSSAAFTPTTVPVIVSRTTPIDSTDVNDAARSCTFVFGVAPSAPGLASRQATIGKPAR